MRKDPQSVTFQRVIKELQRAHAQWQLHETHRKDCEPDTSLSRGQAEEIVVQARGLLAGASAASSDTHDTALIVTKAPHTGSDTTVVAMLARCLAFGLAIERVVRRAPEDADQIAHALYPDVWLNFVRLPSGNSVWTRIDGTFDKSDYATIFGQQYQRAAVVTGHQACLDNHLTQAELMAIWQTGREPLSYATAATQYGRPAADLLFGSNRSMDYQWYRGPFPVGIQKIGSNLMAFSLRHERLYGGRPVVVLNGHFALLSQRFRGVGGRGPTIIELGLEDHPAIADIRRYLIGAADQPKECLPGTIRRDAYDGFFCTDAPDYPVVPWANAVHASDGYLAGAIETASVLGVTTAAVMTRRLTEFGYSRAEIEMLIMKDPIVVADGDEQRLTRRTAMLTRNECMESIRQWFPPLKTEHSPPASAYLLSALIEADAAARLDVALDLPQPEADSRCPGRGSVRNCEDLPADLIGRGEALIAAGGFGLLVPLAGSGGRFGGYDVAEGKGARLKPLLPLFELDGRMVSSLDVRAAHARFLAKRFGVPIPMLLSCSHVTEPRVREWSAGVDSIEVAIARVPEMYRIKLDDWDANAEAPDVSGADDVLRDEYGNPLLKPSGSLGLLLSAIQSGSLQAWQQRGVRVVAAANADDVGFRVDPRILGMFDASPTLDAVVLTIPVGNDESGVVRYPRGGLLREHPAGDGWSAYIEEHAQPPATPRDEQFSTNQIYFRVESLCRLLENPTAESMDALRRRLPLYFEVKQVAIGRRQVGALHAYQTYGDVLRLLPAVTALSMSRTARQGQVGGYAPLKAPPDVAVAQALLDAMRALGDELSFGASL
jgi:hypothetical protein